MFNFQLIKFEKAILYQPLRRSIKYNSYIEVPTDNDDIYRFYFAGTPQINYPKSDKTHSIFLGAIGNNTVAIRLFNSNEERDAWCIIYLDVIKSAISLAKDLDS